MVEISIITICKNSEKEISKTLKSVIDQQQVKIQYVVIDGLSNDNTLNVIKCNLHSNDQVEVISEHDSGISDAMNKGAMLSRGELIYFLHAGDCLLNETILANVYKSYKKYGWRWASGNLLLTRDGVLVNKLKYIPGDINKIRYKNCVPHQATFMERKLFDEIGGFDLDLKQAMDYDLWLRLFYQKGVPLFKLDMDVASFDVDGASAALGPLLIGNLQSHRKIRSNSGSVNFADTLILISGIIIHWIIYRLKVLKIFR